MQFVAKTTESFFAACLIFENHFDKPLNPTGSNVYRNRLCCVGATPSGSHVLATCKIYKRAIPLGLEDKGRIRQDLAKGFRELYIQKLG